MYVGFDSPVPEARSNMVAVELKLLMTGVNCVSLPSLETEVRAMRENMVR
jgi:hypothetical protein